MNTMRSRLLTVIITGALAVVGYFAIPRFPEYIPISNSLPPVRLVRDSYDITVYWKRYSLFVQNIIPYRDSVVEYPPLALFLFAIPGVVSENISEYFSSFVLLSLLALAAAFLLVKHCFLHNAQKTLLFFFVPGFLYFSIYRYDIFSAVFSLAALAAFLKQRWKTAWGLLGVAIGMKLYAWPLAILFFAAKPPNLSRSQKQSFAVGAFFCAAIVAVPILGSIIYAGSSTLFPFLFQFSRPTTPESVWGIISASIASVSPSLSLAFEGIIKILAFSPLALLAILFKKGAIRKDTLVPISTLIIIVEILANSFNSPQWVVWWWPLLLASNPQRDILRAGAVHDILNYIFFPVLFAIQPYGALSALVVVLRTAALAVLARKIYSSVTQYEEPKQLPSSS